jgi:hypothetical protein
LIYLQQKGWRIQLGDNQATSVIQINMKKPESNLMDKIINPAPKRFPFGTGQASPKRRGFLLAIL